LLAREKEQEKVSISSRGASLQGSRLTKSREKLRKVLQEDALLLKEVPNLTYQRDLASVEVGLRTC